MQTPKEMGALIAELRRKKNMTQRALAEWLRRRGRRRPTVPRTVGWYCSTLLPPDLHEKSGPFGPLFRGADEGSRTLLFSLGS